MARMGTEAHSRVPMQGYRVAPEPPASAAANNLGFFGLCSLCFFILAAFAGTVRVASIPLSLLFSCLSLYCLILDPRKEASTVQPAVRKFIRRYSVIFLLFLGWLILSSLWVSPNSQTVERIVYLVSLGLVVINAAVIGLRYGQKVNNWFWVLIFVISFLYFIGGIANSEPVAGRISAFGGGPNVFARIMGLGILSCLYLLSETKAKLAFIGLPVFLLGILLSGSRGGLISLIVALLFLGLIFFRRVVSRPRVLLPLLVSFVLIIFAVSSVPAIRVRIFDRFIETVFVDQYTAGRTDLYSLAIELIERNPLFGVGLGGFEVERGYMLFLTHPHNIFLTTLTEAGLIGLLLLVLLVLSLPLFIIRVAKTQHINNVVYYFMASSLLMLVSAQFSGYFLDSRWIWIFALLAIASSGPSRKVESSHVSVD